MLCDFETEQVAEEQWRHTCRRIGCGFSVVVNRPRAVRMCNVVGVGDAVAWVLNRAGIRVRKTCNCKTRREKLNEIGEAIREPIVRTFQAIFGARPPQE